jgi:Tol biopolymer transport system component
VTPERWQEIERVWHAVLSAPDHQRAAALADLCRGDDELRTEVESLLASLDQASAAGFGAAPGLAPPRTPLIGQQLGPYAVRALLGVGGMGEVYRAHDSTLGRDVALKILPDPWLADTERRLRFEREARLLASLNHPNIAAIYGIHESTPASSSATLKALVLELVEGETLADRLAAHKRGLPIEETTTIAAQIVDALEAAHARGIVHRDLKPANIKITPEGRVKVLDFGLARAVAGDESAGLASSPTVTARGTNAGVLLGTAPYMSPEQARGRPADRRADIWAFGCVLYEMVTGAAPFGGLDVAEVLASVLKSEPNWSAVPAATPPAVRLCLERCLQKDRRQRFHDIGDVRLALAGAFDRPRGDRDAAARTPAMAWAGWVAAVVAIAAALLAVSRPGPVVEALETRLDIATPRTLDPLSFDLSPDGRSMVFSAFDGLTHRLWLRRLESSEAQPLAGTDRGEMPFWSRDGRSIGFFADGELKRIDIADGFVRTLAPAPSPRWGSWNASGTIVFGGVAMGPLQSVPAVGGAMTQVTDLLPGQTSHRFPQFLPDGRRFLLMALGTPEVRGHYLGSLDDRTVRKISERERALVFLPPDHVLIGRNGALLARRLAADGQRVDGEPSLVAPKLMVDLAVTGYAGLRAAASGHIAYRAAAAQSQLLWLDRTGRPSAAVAPADDTQMRFSHLSRDGHTVAVQRVVNGNTDVWLIDLERGIPRRLTEDSGVDGEGVFSPDGRLMTYVGDDAADVYDTFYQRATDGTGGRRLLFKFAERANRYPEDWSRDGRFILFNHETSDTQRDLWALPLSGKAEPIEIARTRFAEGNGAFSPDGQWVAYTSNETGPLQVFLKAFPGPGPNRQLSFRTGRSPRWRSDGRELFYLEENRLMAMPVTPGKGALQFGSPQPLFTFPSGWDGGFAPSPDGQRFLITQTVAEPGPITVILNWKPPSR